MTQSVPLVSCITPTYGRFVFLQEMYWCWLKQTYTNKELIIVNDEPNLEIVCDNPDVKIFNVSTRFVGLGAKRNFCVDNCNEQSQYVLPFDDDDLFLPHHIESLVNGFDDVCNRTKNRLHFKAHNNSYIGYAPDWPFFGASCFQTSYLKKWPLTDSLIKGEDSSILFNNDIKTKVLTTPPSFVYRSGMNIVHASGHSDIKTLQDQGILKDRIDAAIVFKKEHTVVTLMDNMRPDSKILYDLCLKRSKQNI